MTATNLPTEPLNSEDIKPYVNEQRRKLYEEHVKEVQLEEIRRAEKCASMMRNFNRDIVISRTNLTLPKKYEVCYKELGSLGYNISHINNANALVLRYSNDDDDDDDEDEVYDGNC
jgi:hypothetical protein